MITAVHTLIYSYDPPATRRFFRDVLLLPWVNDEPSSDAGSSPQDGSSWLIFDTGPSDMGVAPMEGPFEARAGSGPKHHQLSLMVEDVATYLAGFRERGGTVIDGPTDYSWGRGFEAEVPGADSIMIYEPKHALAVLTTILEEIQG